MPEVKSTRGFFKLIMTTLLQELSLWYCTLGFASIKIGIGIFLVSVSKPRHLLARLGVSSSVLSVAFCAMNTCKMLLKYNSILRDLVFAAKARQDKYSGSTEVYHLSIEQPCMQGSMTSGLDDLHQHHILPSSYKVKEYEQQITILVCDDDGKLFKADIIVETKQFANTTQIDVELGDQIDLISVNDRAEIRKWRRRIQSSFDSLCVEYGVAKVQTNGRSFVAVSGIPSTDDPTQAIKMAYFAAACQKKLHCLISSMKLDSRDNILASMRFGIHTGTGSGPQTDLRQRFSGHRNNFRKVLDRANIMQQYVLAKI